MSHSKSAYGISNADYMVLVNLNFSCNQDTASCNANSGLRGALWGPSNSGGVWGPMLWQVLSIPK